MNNIKTNKDHAITENHPNWNECILRKEEYNQKTNEKRSPFYIDYCRIIHSTAFRRLKFKTQVFFATLNDHTCTRIEHVTHVGSISYTIAKALGLNFELALAIANAHDLGHTPFGHAGETVLNKICEEECQNGNLRTNSFWHEKNGLTFVDNFETLFDRNGDERLLNLTFAVRDGIISHCCEAEDIPSRPREKLLIQENNETKDIQNVNNRKSILNPYTWEGLVVKMADVIAYLGRDLEDSLFIYNLFDRKDILKYAKDYEIPKNLQKIFLDQYNSGIIDSLISDLINSSDLNKPEIGLTYSDNTKQLVNHLRKFSYERIYSQERVLNYKKYVELNLRIIYEFLKSIYSNGNYRDEILKREKSYPILLVEFNKWLKKVENKFNLSKKEDYLLSVIHFISGMTDRYAKRVYEEISTF